MQIQKINTVSFEHKNSVGKINCHNKMPVFKGYEDVMRKVIRRDLKDATDVSSAFKELFSALKLTPGVKISPDLAVLENNGLFSVNRFMEKITAPIAKVPSQLRELVFKAEDDNLVLLDVDNIGSLMMCNFGKKGFLNFIFNSQDARSDIKFLFSSPSCDSFEIGITKDGGLQVEQTDYPNYIISKFGILSRNSIKTGTFDTSTPVW